MVEVLTYKATKVYTPQTSEYAGMAKGIEAVGNGIASGVKTIGKEAERQEKEAAKVKAKDEALAKQARALQDKVQEAQADDFVQRYEIELARQTQVINAQYKDDPTNPEKEKQIRA